MQSRKTPFQLSVVALAVAAALFVLPSLLGAPAVYSAPLAPAPASLPGQVNPETGPDIVCPTGFDLVETWDRFPRWPGDLDNALIFNVHTFDQYGFSLGSDVYGTLVVWSVVGHPELGCPGGSDPLCSVADQLNEHFNILVDGALKAYIADHVPDHTWAQYPNVDLGLLSAGVHAIDFVHAGNPAPSNAANPSVGYKVGLCTQPAGDQGCTLGYWKQTQHFDSWQVYTPGQTLESVFDVPDSLGMDNDTLLEALNYGGGPGVVGGARNLLKQAVASLLNAASGDVGFPLSTTEVIAQTNAALASLNRGTMISLGETFDGYNNLGCPLN